MVLRVIEADTRIDRGALRLEASELVKDYFTGRGPVTEAQANEAEAFFRQLRARDRWLACDCQPDDQPAPLLCTARPMTLRRMAEPNPSHDENCCFVRRSRNEASEIEPGREFANDDLLVHGGYEGVPRARAQGQGDGRDGPRLPAISQVMFRILQDSGRNAVFHNTDPFGRPDALEVYNRMGKTRLCGDRDEEINVQEMLVTASNERASIGHIIRLKERIAQFAPDAWPGRGRPQGYMMGIATGFRYDEEAKHYELNMLGWEQPVFIDARPRIFAEVTPTSARSPYVCIVSYAKATPQGRVRGLRCYLQPCLAPNSWFPVDSSKEKATMKELLRVRSELSADIKMDIRKPLFDVEVKDGDKVIGRCRPDFVVWVNRAGERSKPIAIETMGSSDPAYRNRKVGTHALMRRKYRHLVEHDLSGPTSGSRLAATEAFVCELSGKIERLA